VDGLSRGFEAWGIRGVIYDDSLEKSTKPR
jgi:hypothetical protein